MIRLKWRAAVLLLTFSLVIAVDELRCVVALVGHGARSPLQPFPALDKRIVWPDGYGQLTGAGTRQLFLLGKLLRQKYVHEVHLLSQRLNLSQLFVRSAMNERNVVAAEALVLGLYPDRGDTLTEQEQAHERLWSPPYDVSYPAYVKTDLNLSAQPFDVPLLPGFNYNHSIEQLLDFGTCPRFVHEWPRYFTSTAFSDLLNKYAATLTTLCTVYDINCTKLKTDDLLFYFVDYLLAGEFEGKLPEISRLGLLPAIEELNYEMRLGVLNQSDWTRSVVLHNFSAVVPQLFDRALTNPDNSTKLLVLSTDEATVFSYLFAFRHEQLVHNVPYASHMSFELYRNNDTGAANVTATFNGATVRSNISYTDFKEYVTKTGNLTTSWEKLCQLSTVTH